MRQRDGTGEPHHSGAGIDLGGAQPWLWELVGQEAKAGDDRRPSVRAGSQFEQLDRQHVARPRPFDEHRPADRVDVGEIDPGDVIHGRALVDLPVGCVADMQLNDLPGLELHHRADRVVPHVAQRIPADLVKRSTLHVASLSGTCVACRVIAARGRPDHATIARSSSAGGEPR